VSASKNRPRWEDLPARLRRQIESLVGDRVVAAQNCDGGFSPGFASRLTLAAGIGRGALRWLQSRLSIE
jgi:hypothetical protein